MIPVRQTKNEVKKAAFKLGEYDHEIVEGDLEACGIDKEEFLKRNESMTSIIRGIDDDKNFVSQLAEEMEKTFTPRQIVFMAAKMSLTQMIQQASVRDQIDSQIKMQQKEG